MTDGAPLILITRPQEDAEPLLERLRGLGFDGLVEPMLRVKPVAGVTVDLSDCRAVLFTSANGVRAFAALTPIRDLPAITVGEASARTARGVGFVDVTASGGDVAALAETVRGRFLPEDGVLFHAAGSVSAGDLKGDLEGDGYRVRRTALYETVPVERMSDACRAALDRGRLSAVAFFSPRTAETFVRVLKEEGRSDRVHTVWAVCLSKAVARAASVSQPGTGVEWAGQRIAAHPDSDALVAEILDIFEHDAKPGGSTAMADDAKKSDKDTAAEAVPVAEAMDDFDTDAVIEAFGGIRPMAAKLEIAVSTVQGWKTRSHIPENRWRDIITAASVHNVDLGTALPDRDVPDRDIPDRDLPEDLPETNRSDDINQTDDADTVIDDEDRPDPEPPGPKAGTQDDTGPSREMDSDDTKLEPEGSPAGGGRLALLVAVAALAAVVLRPVWGPHVDPHFAKFAPPLQQQGTPAPASPDPGGVTAALDSLEQRLSTLESRPAASSDPAVGSDPQAIPTELLDRLAALEAELTALSDVVESLQSVRDEANAAITQTRNALAASVERDEAGRARLVERLGVMESLLEQVTREAEQATAGLAGLEALIARNSAGIQALESRPALEGAAQAGLALAVGDVESALSFGRPYDGALARLTGLAGGSPDIAAAAAALAPHAGGGVATRATLITDFQRDLPVIQAELTRRDGDVLDVLMDAAQSLISVRRKGETPDAPAVSRAEAALARGDLSSAVAALSPQREASATAAAWLDRAEARLAAESALLDLRSAVAAGLTGSVPDPQSSTPAAPAEGPAEDPAAAPADSGERS